MKALSLCLLTICLSLTGAGQQKVSTTVVRYVSGKDTVSGYLCMPEGKGPFPALIAIHEWWGLNEWVEETAMKFASIGYVTLAVDLYRGKATQSPDEAHELMRGLPEDRAARDLQAAAQYLKTRSNVDPKKIGSIGWCMGGGFSLVTALNVPDLAACVICYGRLVTDSSSIQKIPCPILGIFGEEDMGISPQSVREFETACKSAGKSIEVKIYEKAGHAFMNPNNAKAYRGASAKDAWSRIQTFLEKTLKRS